MEERPPDTAAESLADQVRRLVDREVGIARDELQDKAAAVAGDAALLVGAGICGSGALLAFLAAAIDATRGPRRLDATRRPVWQAAGLVGGLLGAGGLFLAVLGAARLRRRDLLPSRPKPLL